MTKIDSRDYEAGEALTTKEAIKWMADGNVAISENVKGTVYHFDDDNGFGWVDKNGVFGFGVRFTSVVESVWRKAVLIRKPISWEEAVRALLEGKHVWDGCNDEWKRVDELFMLGGDRFSWAKQEFTGAYGPFYLTPHPVADKSVDPPKLRRKVSREDAICAMVRNPEQHCWGEYEYRWNPIGCRTDYFSENGNHPGWYGSGLDAGEYYLDPPEAK